MARHNEIGKQGEAIAREYLIGKGYAITDTNVRIGKKEIDIVAMHDSRIVFVEVKTRTNDLDDGTEAIDSKKMFLLAKAGERYVRTYGIPHEVQFDVIVVKGDPQGKYEITHYPDAFMPPMTTYGKR